MWDRLDSFHFLLLSSHPSAFLPLLLLPFLCVCIPCSLSLSVNLGKFCDNSRLDFKKKKIGKKQSSLILASPLLKKTYCRRMMMLQLIYFKELSQTHTHEHMSTHKYEHSDTQRHTDTYVCKQSTHNARARGRELSTERVLNPGKSALPANKRPFLTRAGRLITVQQGYRNVENMWT